MNALCRRLRLPGIIGMLAAGMLLGPYALNLLDGQILDISRHRCGRWRWW